MPTAEFLLEMQGIRKTFPGVLALDDVQLKLQAGTVHALMGENGAGKSTIMKVLAGIYPKDAGTIIWEGQQVEITSIQRAMELGISMIHQELSPVPELTVAENIFLGRETLNRAGLVSYKGMFRACQELFDKWQIRINPKTRLKYLSVAQIQMVEIAKAISFDSKLIIMDEPTSAITEREVAHLHDMIRQLTARGKAVVYITHKMDEVFKICDYVTVFRDGHYIRSAALQDITRDDLIAAMVGRSVTQMFPKEDVEIGEVILSVKGLTQGHTVQDVSFDLHRGEILGFAGLMGAGRTEVLETIFGLRLKDAGTITMDGKELNIKCPRDAIKANIGLLTEDRRRTGTMGVLSLLDNMSVSSLGRFRKGAFLKRRAIREACKQQQQALAIKTPSLRQLIMNLSGGNQQKVLLSRWLLTLPEILMIDEPTRGIDVGAKSEFHKLMTMLAKEGKAIIMVSSEMPEVLGMSDRIIVMHEGHISGELSRAEADQEKIMRLATNIEEKENSNV